MGHATKAAHKDADLHADADTHTHTHTHTHTQVKIPTVLCDSDNT